MDLFRLNWVVGLMFALGCNWAAAQGDSALFPSGSIKVVRPDVKPVILVKVAYVAFAKRRDARKWDQHGKVSDLITLSDLDARQTITIQNPVPVSDTMTSPELNWQEYFEKNFTYRYKFNADPVLDTVKIKVLVKKNGRFAYSLMESTCSNETVKQVFFAEMNEVVKWKPAMILRSTWQDGGRKKNVSAGIIFTIIVSVDPFEQKMSKSK